MSFVQWRSEAYLKPGDNQYYTVSLLEVCGIWRICKLVEGGGLEAQCPHTEITVVGKETGSRRAES